MNSQNNKISILIVGAFGHLGALVTKYCLAQPKLLVNILVRDPQKNKELAEAVTKAGGRVWQGDVTKPETLDEPTKGVHTVLSTTGLATSQADLEGQYALVDACVRNGIKRFSPSDYAENAEKFSREELKELGVIEFKNLVHDHLKGKPIQVIHFGQGVFLDSFFEYFGKDFGYWGNVDHVYDLTSYEDTAKFVAAAIVDENRTGLYNFSANRLTINQIAEIYNKERGAKVVPKHNGTLEQLRNIYNQAKNANPPNPMAFLFAISLFIYDDRSTFDLDKIHNGEFPDVKTTSIEEYLKQNPNAKINEPTQ